MYSCSDELVRMLGQNELHCNQIVSEKIKYDRAQSSQHVNHYRIHAVRVCYLDNL